MQHIIWERNGVALDSSTAGYHTSFPDDASSNLTFAMTLEREGGYRCKVMDGNYTVVSREVNPRLPGERAVVQFHVALAGGCVVIEVAACCNS